MGRKNIKKTLLLKTIFFCKFTKYNDKNCFPHQNFRIFAELINNSEQYVELEKSYRLFFSFVSSAVL